jgi:uncharacterized protein YndB with AHSA1/START domain
MRIPWPLLLALLLWSPLAGAQPTDGGDIHVTVSRKGSAIDIHARMRVAASPEQVWQVLTDYDHMAAFTPGLEKSSAQPIGPNRLRVEQSGKLRFAIFSIPYQSVREVELEPYREVRSRAVAGTIRSGSALTLLKQQDGVTTVDYESNSVPAVRLPFGLGLGMVAERTRDQFQRLREEVARRMGAVPGAAPARAR